jgi:DNA-binding NarL/FixJ family response regulator
MRTIRVVLGDDHTLVRQGLRTLLEAASIRVTGESGDGRELIRTVRHLRPDVAIVDVSMPLLNGLEATRRLGQVSPETRVLILSMYPDPGYVARAKRLGAMGYVLKDEAPQRLIEAVRAVAAGETYFHLPSAPAQDNPLTPREREVLQLVAEGKKNAEIAEVMMRSLHTIRNHRARLMRKLGAHNAADLVRAAEALGLVRLAPPRKVNDGT